MKVLKKRASGVLARMIAERDPLNLAKTRNKMMIASKIADGLKAKGLTQKAFAIKMGKTESEISDWLSGDRNFQLDTLTEIEEFLGIRLIDTQTMGMPVYNNVVILHIKKKNETFMCKENLWGKLDNNYMTTSKVS